MTSDIVPPVKGKAGGNFQEYKDWPLQVWIPLQTCPSYMSVNKFLQFPELEVHSSCGHWWKGLYRRDTPPGPWEVPDNKSLRSPFFSLSWLTSSGTHSTISTNMFSLINDCFFLSMISVLIAKWLFVSQKSPVILMYKINHP